MTSTVATGMVQGNLRAHVDAFFGSLSIGQRHSRDWMHVASSSVTHNDSCSADLRLPLSELEGHVTAAQRSTAGRINYSDVSSGRGFTAHSPPARLQHRTKSVTESRYRA
jgi:hypothetical protein